MWTSSVWGRSPYPCPALVHQLAPGKNAAGRGRLPKKQIKFLLGQNGLLPVSCDRQCAAVEYHSAQRSAALVIDLGAAQQGLHPPEHFVDVHGLYQEPPPRGGSLFLGDRRFTLYRCASQNHASFQPMASCRIPIKSAYRPGCCISSSWVPRWTICPPSSTRI